jgi:hypothetical protein
MSGVQTRANAVQQRSAASNRVGLRLDGHSRVAQSGWTAG